MGQLANSLFKVLISDFQRLMGVALWFPVKCNLIFVLGQMPVDTVIGNVELSALKPFNMYGFVETDIFHLAPFFIPVEAFSGFCPKSFIVIERLLIKLYVSRAID